jgi:hypothetical protein
VSLQNRIRKAGQHGGSAVAGTIVDNNHLDTFEKFRFPKRNQPAKARFDAGTPFAPPPGSLLTAPTGLRIVRG